MKKIIQTLAVALIMLSFQSLNAQGFLKKLQQAMEPKAINGFYEASRASNGKYAMLALPQGLREIGNFSEESDGRKRFYYKSSVLNDDWYSLVKGANTSKPVYYHCINACDKVAFQVEDSTFYFFYFEKGIDWNTYKLDASTNLFTIVSNKKQLIRDCADWKYAETPNNETIKKHLEIIAQLLNEVKTSISATKASYAKEQDDKIFNSPLPKPGNAFRCKAFAKAREVAPKLLKEYWADRGYTHFEPLYAYDKFNNPDFDVVKNSLGLQTDRQVQLWVVCKNNKPGEYKFGEKLYKTKYIVCLVNLREEGSGNTFSGKY